MEVGAAEPRLVTARPSQRLCIAALIGEQYSFIRVIRRTSAMFVSLHQRSRANSGYESSLEQTTLQ